METVKREEIIDVKGTTRLKIGDPWYFEKIETSQDFGCEKKLTFDGHISAAPLGKLRIRQMHITENHISFDVIDVSVFQAAQKPLLDIYLQDKHYKDSMKDDIELGCDTARFEIETKFGSDEFRTGADGYYGHIQKYKQYYGMRLDLTFDADLFTFEEIKERMLRLFPEQKPSKKQNKKE